MTSVNALDWHGSLDRQFELACRIVHECQHPARLSSESKDDRLLRLPFAESNPANGVTTCID
jgi:hypothetical protein